MYIHQHIFIGMKRMGLTLICISLCLYPPVKCTGQTQATAGQEVSSNGSSGPSMQSDPSAVEMLKLLLDQGGGRKAWSGIHSAKFKADVSMSGVSGTRSSLLVDDWSSRETKYRRKFEGRSEQPIEHNGTRTFAVRKGKDVKRVPEFDQARVLLSHMPLAAAEILLRRPEYRVSLPKYRRCSSDSSCFDVYRAIGNSSVSLREQEWTISNSTHLPTVIRYILPNTGGGLMQWKEIDFTQFASVNGLSVPTDIDIKLPGGLKQHWHYSLLGTNVAFDAQVFDGEAVR